MIKNRSGPHEDSIREIRVDANGLRLSEPLQAFRGILTGTPEFIGDEAPLLDRNADKR